MSILAYLVVGTGLTASVALLALALAKGRAAPPHRAAWVVGLVVLGIDAALHVVASVGMLVAGATEALWFHLGTLGFLAILAVAVLRPRWAGIALLASAVLVPVMLLIGGVVGSSEGPVDVPWQVAGITYSVPAILSGSLLVGSSVPRRVRTPVGLRRAEPRPT